MTKSRIIRFNRLYVKLSLVKALRTIWSQRRRRRREQVQKEEKEKAGVIHNTKVHIDLTRKYWKVGFCSAYSVNAPRRVNLGARAGYFFTCDGFGLLLKRRSKHNDKTWVRC